MSAIRFAFTSIVCDYNVVDELARPTGVVQGSNDEESRRTLAHPKESQYVRMKQRVQEQACLSQGHGASEEAVGQASNEPSALTRGAAPLTHFGDADPSLSSCVLQVTLVKDRIMPRLILLSRVDDEGIKADVSKAYASISSNAECQVRCMTHRISVGGGFERCRT